YRSLVQMIAGRFGTAGISGPIGVAGTIGEVASYGFAPLLQLFVLISINLGLCNLLPLPALDGGRLLFVILEMIRRKPINPKYETAIHAVGMILLLALTGIIAVMDITRLIGG
ncbi:MAG: site-2 protease family protein, partial [Clostridia bacterium]|nr:site-2 protease family protein [Clostridia bacterium]